jgi:hypothetical protein
LKNQAFRAKPICPSAVAFWTKTAQNATAEKSDCVLQRFKLGYLLK